jgi:hypothetical protein
LHFSDAWDVPMDAANAERPPNACAVGVEEKIVNRIVKTI